MELVDTRDFSLLGNNRVNPVPNLVSKIAVCAKFCAKLVKSKISKNMKKVFSYRELNDMPAWWNW